MAKIRNILRLCAALWQFWIALAITGLSTWLVYLYAPPQHNPWRPLSLNDPIGTTTAGKLSKLAHDPSLCRQMLDEAPVAYILLKDEETGPGCGLSNGLALDRIRVPYSAELRLTCSLAAGLYIWESQSAAPLAETLLGSPLARIETYGTYACRNVAGSSRRSEHATANAIDIAGFHLADGRYLSVFDHWGKDTPEGEYLERMRDTACSLFAATLGPDYNTAHRDHFHLDLGRARICR